MSAQELLFGPGPILFVQHTLGLGWPFPFRVLSLLGTTWGVVAALGLALWWWGRTTVYAVMGIVVAEAAVSLVLNRVFSVDRPDALGIVKYEYVAMGSFPSGHVFTAVAAWGVLYARGHVRFAVPAAVALGVATARLYLGVHYLGDVIGATVLGVALVAGYARVWPRAERWLAARPGAFFTGLALAFAATGVAGVLVIFPGNPYVARACGVMVCAPAALAFEHRRVRQPPAKRGRMRAGIVALGLAGIAVPLALSWNVDETRPVFSALATAFATLWALLVTPALARALAHN